MPQTSRGRASLYFLCVLLEIKKTGFTSGALCKGRKKKNPKTSVCLIGTMLQFSAETNYSKGVVLVMALKLPFSGDREVVPRPDVHPGGRHRYRSFDFAADQRGSALGAHQAGAELRTGPQREK